MKPQKKKINIPYPRLPFGSFHLCSSTLRYSSCCYLPFPFIFVLLLDWHYFTSFLFIFVVLSCICHLCLHCVFSFFSLVFVLLHLSSLCYITSLSCPSCISLLHLNSFHYTPHMKLKGGWLWGGDIGFTVSMFLSVHRSWCCPDHVFSVNCSTFHNHFFFVFFWGGS